MAEVLVAKKDRDAIKIKVADRETNRWSPSKYEKVIANRDYNLLAFLFWDLEKMGFPIEKAINRFRALKDDPELFFLK